MRSFYLSLFLVFIFSTTVSAQVKYGISTTVGKSMLLKEYQLSYMLTGDKHSPLTNWSVGAFVKVPLWKTPFSIRQEIGFRPFYSKIEHGGFESPKKYQIINRMKSIALPFSLEYSYVPWLSVYGGLTYSYNFDLTGRYMSEDLMSHTLGYHGGIDYIWKDRISLGVFYYKSLGYFQESVHGDVAYKGLNYGIRLAYTIN
jgi:hypothetical protein